MPFKSHQHSLATTALTGWFEDAVPDLLLKLQVYRIVFPGADDRARINSLEQTLGELLWEARVGRERQAKFQFNLTAPILPETGPENLKLQKPLLIPQQDSSDIYGFTWERRSAGENRIEVRLDAFPWRAAGERRIAAGVMHFTLEKSDNGPWQARADSSQPPWGDPEGAGKAIWVHPVLNEQTNLASVLIRLALRLAAASKVESLDLSGIQNLQMPMTQTGKRLNKRLPVSKAPLLEQAILLKSRTGSNSKETKRPELRAARSKGLSVPLLEKMIRDMTLRELEAGGNPDTGFAVSTEERSAHDDLRRLKHRLEIDYPAYDYKWVQDLKTDQNFALIEISPKPKARRRGRSEMRLPGSFSGGLHKTIEESRRLVVTSVLLLNRLQSGLRSAQFLTKAGLDEKTRREWTAYHRAHLYPETLAGFTGYMGRVREVFHAARELDVFWENSDSAQAEELESLFAELEEHLSRLYTVQSEVLQVRRELLSEWKKGGRNELRSAESGNGEVWARASDPATEVIIERLAALGNALDGNKLEPGEVARIGWISRLKSVYERLDFVQQSVRAWDFSTAQEVLKRIRNEMDGEPLFDGARRIIDELIVKLEIRRTELRSVSEEARTEEASKVAGLEKHAQQLARDRKWVGLPYLAKAHGVSFETAARVLLRNGFVFKGPSELGDQYVYDPRAVVKAELRSLEIPEWKADYGFRPRLLGEDRAALRKEALSTMLAAGGYTKPEAAALEAILNGEETVAEPEVLQSLERKGGLVRTTQGVPVPVSWIETADTVPVERRSKILAALISEGLLEKAVGREIETGSRLDIEYFDHRGDNRRVMLAALDKEKPFVLKYTHIHRALIEEQFGLAQQVHDYEAEFHAGEDLYASLEKRYGPETVPTVRPGSFVKVEGTEIFTEEFLDGPTRQDLLPYLLDEKGMSEESVRRQLTRIEGRGLSRIWKATEKFGRGKFLMDLTARNVKYVRVAGRVVAKYFDFERFSQGEAWSTLGEYMNNKDLPYLSHSGFVLGWAEGLGREDAFDFFRSVDFDRDRLGLMIHLLAAVAELAADGGRTNFYLPASGAGLEAGARQEALLGFVYGVLANSRGLELPATREQAAESIAHWLGGYSETDKKANREFADVLADALLGARETGPEGLEALIQTLRAARTGRENRKRLFYSYGDPGARPELREAGNARATRRAMANPKHSYTIVTELGVFERLAPEQREEYYKLFALYQGSGLVEFVFPMTSDRALTPALQELMHFRDRFAHVKLPMNPSSLRLDGRRVIRVDREGVKGAFAALLKQVPDDKELFPVLYLNNNRSPGLLTAALRLLNSGQEDQLRREGGFSKVPESLTGEIQQVLTSFVYVSRSA